MNGFVTNLSLNLIGRPKTGRFHFLYWEVAGGMPDAGFTRRIRWLHPFYLLILCFSLPLVPVFVVGIWLLLSKVVTISQREVNVLAKL
jgi:hypothetical protein